jgi:hypothetical protein
VVMTRSYARKLRAWRISHRQSPTTSWWLWTFKGVAIICTTQKLPRRKLCRTKVNNWCSQLETWHILQLTPLLQLTVATNIVKFLVCLVFKDPITLKNFQKHISFLLC